MPLFGKGKSDDPLVLMQQGQYKEAVKFLQAKLRRAPHDFSLKMRLAEAYEGAGKKDAASEIYVAEGEAALHEGDRAKALALLKKAARALPEDAGLRDRVAQLEGSREPGGDEAFSFDVGAAGAGREPEAGSPSPEAAEVPPSPAPAGGGAEEVVEFEMAEDPGTPPAAEQGEAGPAEAPVDETAARPVPFLEDHLPLLEELFPELNAEESSLLGLVASPRYLSPGEVLVREQEEGDSLFIIARGRLGARGRFESGTVDLGILGEGDLIGEVAFLKKVPRTATVTALEPSLVLELPAEETRRQLAGHPEVLGNLERILQTRVERTLVLLKERIRQGHGD